MTSLPGVPQYKCRREDTSSAFSSSLTDLFEACKVNLVRVQFSFLLWRALAKRLGSVWIVSSLFDTRWHTRLLRCLLGIEHTRDVFEGAVCVHCERLPMRTLRSRMSLFSRKEGQPSASRDSNPTAAEARRRLRSWGSQADLADEFERELSLSHESAKSESEPLDYDDVISLTSSDPAASALLGCAQEEQEMSEKEDVETELSQDSCPVYEELLDVMERATARLDLPWERTKMAAPRGRLDERFLSDHKTSAQVNLPFLPDLHTEVEKERKKPFSARIHKFQHNSYANIAGMRENGYERMPPVEETLASYLSMGETPSLKVPSLPSGPLQATSRLNGRAYAAAGQAVASLHTMAVLQAVPGGPAEGPG